MKKLMVTVAMAIACTASSFAGTSEGIVYEVKCALTTTKAKQVTPKKTSYTVNFGMDAKKNGKFWYMDDAIEQNADQDWYGDVGSYEKVIVYDADFKTSQGHFSNAFELLEPEDKLEVVKMLSYNEATKKTVYNYKSANKWCATVKFTIVPDTVCYRVAETEKTVGYLIEVNDCCCGIGSDVPKLYWSNDTEFDDLQLVNVLQYNRFNGATANKANKTELLLNIGDCSTIGGFGSYDVKNGYMKTFSGYILGLAEAPVCETCCSAPVNSIVHTICGDEADCSTKVIKGTVSLKYNKKLTQRYNEARD